MWEKIKALWAKLGDTKIVLVIIGVITLIVKFRSIIIDLLVKDSKKTLDDATKKDDQLKAEETQANQQADALVKKAAEEGKTDAPVDENWNVKK